MIVGVFLRNYKVYSNLNFVSLVESPDNNLSVFIGPNGSGKSSVLEALDCVFNGREWNVSLGQKKQDSSICPVFLIPRKEIQDQKSLLVSNYFWNTDFESMPGSQKAIGDFCALREKIKQEVDPLDYLLIPVGLDYERKTIFTSTFNNAHFNHVRSKGVARSDLERLKNQIYSLYSYIYIPIDLSPSELLSLQAREMQGLMDKSVIDEIKSLLEKKDPKVLDSNKPQSIVAAINERLSGYIDSINDAMGDGYEFGVKGNTKKTIKSNDFIGVIINEFFLKRPLSKDGKEIKRLSSGEQRLALIDLAYTFLRRNTAKNKKIILAIDEPEASLQDSLCLEQFHKLFEIGGKFGHQVVITTHWYGLLITTANGYLHCVDTKKNQAPSIKTLRLYRVHEERRSFPNQVEMKSFFDLISSMLSILKTKQHNWIVCEGFDDVCYLKAHLDLDEGTTTIIPLNGCGNVVKLFKFLRVPFEDKKENSLIKGRVLCITDSDQEELIRIHDYSSDSTSRKLDLWRWQLSADKEKVQLVNTNNNSSYATEIEDCLNPKAYTRAVNASAKKHQPLKELISRFKEDSSAIYSAAVRDLGFLDSSSGDLQRFKKELMMLITSEEIKHSIAINYLNGIRQEEKEIDWGKKIKEFIFD